jgi:hypothetical protein
MSKRTIKILGLALALVVVAAVVAVASGATGAYFSDTKSGAITGDIGSIKVTTSGGTGADGLNFTWDNMLPGVQYSATATYQNTGDSVQDVWLVFPNDTARSSFNSLGRFGAARVTSTNGASFYSNNLNDHPVDQGSVVKMLPAKILLAQNVGPTASGSMTFTFAYASNMSTQEPGGVFNLYPRSTPGSPAGASWPSDNNQANFDQNFVGAGYLNPDGTWNGVSGNGLPFQIVATQPGIEPGAAGDYAGL